MIFDSERRRHAIRAPKIEGYGVVLINFSAVDALEDFGSRLLHIHCLSKPGQFKRNVQRKSKFIGGCLICRVRHTPLRNVKIHKTKSKLLGVLVTICVDRSSPKAKVTRTLDAFTSITKRMIELPDYCLVIAELVGLIPQIHIYFFTNLLHTHIFHESIDVLSSI